MFDQEDFQVISPELALLLIDEGFAVRTPEHQIFQRNPGLNYFDFRKWRKTEDFTIKNENRDKVYCIGETIQVFSKTQFLEHLRDKNLELIPPRGHYYNPRQLKTIYIDASKMIHILNSFLHPSRH